MMGRLHPTRLLRSCFFTTFLISLLLSGCSPALDQPTQEIVLYNWEGDIPQEILDQFTSEYDIEIRYEVFESQEEAVENIRAGQVYDVIVLESRFVPILANDGLLAKLDYQNIVNFKHISPNFRNLAYDPENQYSIPYSWGVTGLLVRTDLVQSKIARWSDLWDERYKGKVAIWMGQPREVISFTLKSLGYSANSEDPHELELALEKLIALKPRLLYLEDFGLEDASPAMASNQIAFAMGYAGDYAASISLDLPVEYVFPEEGILIWGDTFAVPANSPHKQTAELFINFLLQPEVSAEIVNQKHYASANQNAGAFIESYIFNDQSIYPNNDKLKNAEIILPLSVEGQKLYDEIWQKFMEAGPQ